MRGGRIMGVAAAIALGGTLAGTAATASDRMGSKAIFAGDYAGAARHLEAERQRRGDQPELLLNLAAAYGMVGRMADARTLYAAVLDAPAVDMDLRSGDVVSSHVIASRGLAKLSQHIAAR